MSGMGIENPITKVNSKRVLHAVYPIGLQDNCHETGIV